MTVILLFNSSLNSVVLLGLMILACLVFIGLIIWQHRQSTDLRFELEQLDKLKENNIESEFVLRAMHLSTWHLNPKTMTITFDNDFRDRTTWIVPTTEDSSFDDLKQQFNADDAVRVGKAMLDLCEGRTENYHVEYRVLIPNSDKFYWEESYATIVERDVEGKPTSIVGTTMRIDDRKRMEEDLIDARNRAEESDRMKTAFIANISHEIRTPLNAIVGFTSVLPDITNDMERRSLLDMIHENTQKLLHIIDDVVNISRIESGQDQMVLTSFDLNMTLREISERYRQELSNNVELKTQFACEHINITTDYNRFCEILRHLLSNAVKFTNQGSIVLGYDVPKDGRLHVWVHDTGIGIAEEFQKRVFERFFKVDEFIPGAGLGLSICQTMAFSMGGSVSVKSKKGEGSVFTLDLPMQ